MKTLHVRCGSDIRETLNEANIDGDFLEWSDPLCRGPAPSNLDRVSLIKMRAQWLASFSDLDANDVCRDLGLADQELGKISQYSRVLFWFEHDLYDQICLIALLSQLSYQPGMELISIDRHPAHERFIGFGQLSPTELAPLVDQGSPLTAEMISVAREAYAVYRKGDSDAVRHLAEAEDTARLFPFLPGALHRHLQDLPSASSGLTLTESLTLQALAAGSKTPGQCFRTLMMETDPQPFLGDLLYWEDILRLATASVPAIEPVPDNWPSPVTLTEFGRALLDGSAKWGDQNQRDHWWGGKHLV